MSEKNITSGLDLAVGYETNGSTTVVVVQLSMFYPIVGGDTLGICLTRNPPSWCVCGGEGVIDWYILQAPRL